MSSNRHLRAALAVLFLVSALVLASCAQRAVSIGVDTAPIRAWVGGPMDGIEIPMGANSALCHGFAIAGVSHVELYVNGGFANRMANPDPSEEYFTSELGFNADAAGAYVLECVTFDQGGLTAWSDPVTVFVTGEEPSPTTEEEEIPTATPTATEVSPTEVPPTSTSIPPTPTEVPPTSIPPTSTRIPPTSTPLPPSPTLEPPRIVSFEVSKSQITLGECVTFSYVVAGSPTAIYFDGQGVAGPAGSVDRCPTATREFELTAELNNQVVDRASLTVVVIQPSPTTNTGPSITNVSESTNDVDWPEPFCTQCQYPSQVTISANISDPDGVAGAKVSFRIKAGGAQWQALPMNPGRTGAYSATITGEWLQKSLDPPVPYGAVCSSTSSLEYYVQAYDGLNNYSQSGTGTVTVHYCYIIK